MNEKIRNKIREILQKIKQKDVQGNSGFALNRDTISHIFETPAQNAQDIQVRLTLIDSMYSTQMNRRYYALEELAEVLWELNGDKPKHLEELFEQFAQEKNASLFDYPNSKQKIYNLWSREYGIGKDGQSKGMAISLISKYAYFSTGYKFPIYDSIAREMILLLCPGTHVPSKTESLKNGSGKSYGEYIIEWFLENISALCETYDTDFDHLDRLLWFVGKILRGNLSLVLTRQQYNNLLALKRKGAEESKKSKKSKKSDISEKFDITKMNIEELGLDKNDLIFDFFELAKMLADEAATQGHE